jgi:phosphohistidine phosphatase SixA
MGRGASTVHAAGTAHRIPAADPSRPVTPSGDKKSRAASEALREFIVSPFRCQVSGVRLIADS